MGVTVDWHNSTAPQTIICYRFENKWTWDEFYVCWAWVKQAMASVDHKVSLIYDMRATRHIPVNSIPHLRAVVLRVNPNYSGRSVMVGTGAIGPAINTMLIKLNPSLRAKYQVHFVSTLAEAECLLDDWVTN